MMMYVEGHWEAVDTLQDITKIIREYYNEGLAYELENQIDSLVNEYNNKIEELEYQIDDLEANDYY